MSSKASKHSDHFKSAFYFYLQEKYDEAKEENPDLDLNDLTADCGDKWKVKINNIKFDTLLISNL